MARSLACTIVAIAALAACFDSQLSAQPTPNFVVSVKPSTVTITQGGMATLTIKTVLNERPDFAFSLAGLPSGVVAQVPAGHAGDNTIVLTAMAGASTGTANVTLTVQAGYNQQSQTFLLNVKPIPVTQWEYHLETAATQQEFENAATTLGLQSWELVSVVLHDRQGKPEWVGCFKRQKRQTNH